MKGLEKRVCAPFPHSDGSFSGRGESVSFTPSDGATPTNPPCVTSRAILLQPFFQQATHSMCIRFLLVASVTSKEDDERVSCWTVLSQVEVNPRAFCLLPILQSKSNVPNFSDCQLYHPLAPVIAFHIFGRCFFSRLATKMMMKITITGRMKYSGMWRMSSPIRPKSIRVTPWALMMMSR